MDFLGKWSYMLRLVGYCQIVFQSGPNNVDIYQECIKDPTSSSRFFSTLGLFFFSFFLSLFFSLYFFLFLLPKSALSSFLPLFLFSLLPSLSFFLVLLFWFVLAFLLQWFSISWCFKFVLAWRIIMLSIFHIFIVHLDPYFYEVLVKCFVILFLDCISH